jgi:hypothetical protein
MNRKQLLAELEKEYANIYEFTDGHGDDPLNILDEFCEQAGLGDASSDLMYAMADGEDPETLSNEVLSQLLQVFKEVVQECKVELQD